MNSKIYAIIFISITFFGCSQRLKRPEHLPENAKHTYIITTVDDQGRPIGNAELSVKSIDLASVWNGGMPFTKTTKIKSGANGEVSVDVTSTLTQHWKGGYYTETGNQELERQRFDHGGKDIWGYFTELTVTDSKNRESTKSTFSQAPGNIKIPISVRVSTIDDFYCPEILQKTDEKTREILRSISGQILWPTENSGGLQFEKLCQATLKEKNYISLEYRLNKRFYETKQNNYEIGVQIFDDIVRPALNPAIKIIEQMRPHGVLLRVKLKKYKAVDSGTNGISLQYDFFLPSENVKQYKRTDISGQKLINNSIIMFNNDRIDLDLK